MRSLIVIAHNIRSTHNIGSILRTADGFGVEHIYLTGITPYPHSSNDSRLPHISQKLTHQINKTALGAIYTVNWSYHSNMSNLLTQIKTEGFKLIGLEQSSKSIALKDFSPPNKCALLLGNEIEGITPKFQDLCDYIVEITMYGQKESFNVAQACAIGLYALREA